MKEDRESMPGEEQAILEKTRAYVSCCRESAEGLRGRGRFPNLAGLCVALDMGIEEFEREMEARPRLRDMICTLLEDEAINFDPSTSMISTYLKKRLGYGEKSGGGRTACESGGMQLVFEHDIYEDGGG